MVFSGMITLVEMGEGRDERTWLIPGVRGVAGVQKST